MVWVQKRRHATEQQIWLKGKKYCQYTGGLIIPHCKVNSLGEWNNSNVLHFQSMKYKII